MHRWNPCPTREPLDPRFGLVFLKEMAALLKVLCEGDGTLYQLACKTMEQCRAMVQVEDGDVTEVKVTIGQ